MCLSENHLCETILSSIDWRKDFMADLPETSYRRPEKL